MLKKIKQQCEEFEARIEAEREKFLKELLEELNNNENIKFFMIKGWTPSFNDGEPCEHTTDVYIGLK